MVRDVIDIAIRTSILYFFVLFTVRVMGKRSVANLAPFDLAVIIVMGSAAAIPMEDDSIHLLRGILPVVLLGLFQYLVSVVNLYVRPFEKITQGVPVLLVQNGQVLWNNLKRERVTLEDLRVMLREKEVSDISDVQEARLEPDGRTSVIKRKDASPLTPKNLQELANIRLEAVLEETARSLRTEISQLFAEAEGRRNLS